VILEMILRCVIVIYDAATFRNPSWGLTLIMADLFLLDNQVPFFILEKLYDVGGGVRGSRELLINLIIEYTRDRDKQPIMRPSSDSEIHHLLHLYYESFVPKLSPEVKYSSWATNTVVIPPATALSNIGVTLS